MFFLLSKIFYFLLLPFSWIVLFFVWSYVTRNPIWKRKLRTGALLLLLIFSNPWLSHKALQWLEEEPNPIQKTYKIGIVLSGILENGMNTSEQTHLTQSADRIVEAIRLYKNGIIQQILITGGKADIHFTNAHEGQSLVKLVKSMGVPDSAILLENRAKNTFENAKFTYELLGDGSGDLLLITSAFHMKRASACFRKVGFKPDTYPVDFRSPSEFRWPHLFPKSSALENWNVVTKEITGLIVYKLVGYI